MADDPDLKRLDAFDERLAAARKPKAGSRKKERHAEHAHAGWRMVTELVVGLLLGFGIGYGVDHVFGTMPIFMVLFTGFGFAAGVRTMMRTAEEIQTKISEAGDTPVTSAPADDKQDD